MARRERSTVTLKDVAEVAGVSASTASRVLNSGTPVTPDLEERVRTAARELGYVADVAARALRGSQGMLAILADELGVEALAEMASAAVAVAAEAGLTTSVSSAGFDPERQLEALRMVRTMRPRGLILTGGWVSMPEIRESLEEELRDYVDRDGGRVVVMGPPSVSYPSVGFDDRGIGVEVAVHMSAQGARSAVILAGPESHRGFRERREGFFSGLESGGVSDIRIVYSANDRAAAAVALSAALDDRVSELVLSVNDRMAVGAYDELDRRGLRVPEDVAVSGVDDLPIAADLWPPLTTVKQPFATAGEMAVQLLLDDDPSRSTQLQLRGTLVIRESSPRRRS